MSNNKKRKKGFSLVELIVVIAIIGILAAVAVPKYSQYRNNANISADNLTAKLIADATIMAIEADNLSESVKIKNTTGTGWSDITDYVSDTSIKSDASKTWKVFTDSGVLYVCAAPAASEAVKATWDASKIRVEIDY